MEQYKNNISLNIEYMLQFFKNKQTLARFLGEDPMIISRAHNKSSVSLEKISSMSKRANLDFGWLLNNPEDFKKEFEKSNAKLIEKFNELGTLTANNFPSKYKTIKMLIWNLQWATPDSERQKKIDAIIRDENPNIICATETYLDSWKDYPYVVSSEENYGYKITEGRRKVILISNEPFTDIDTIGHKSLPSGRFVKAATYGINVYGVCIPWKDAHVSTGRKDKISWEDHIDYLNGLKELLSNEEDLSVIAGDYNQRIPKKFATEKVYETLIKTFSNCHIYTNNIIEPINKQSIDHFTSTKALEILSIRSIDNNQDGTTLSDHFGVIIEFSV